MDISIGNDVLGLLVTATLGSLKARIITTGGRAHVYVIEQTLKLSWVP
jgi:hypothetical protein